MVGHAGSLTAGAFGPTSVVLEPARRTNAPDTLDGGWSNRSGFFAFKMGTKA
ncbi:hypothetical protein PENSUB_821 [Penicillium subrubescens]|uniref:Uncharacterized protein n=1 Tax=Penicillium subrubescens TaxID=1316194 RepID=A0A1Q5UME4_9EURO|nr:hypothetical protein PENSUB_821 [Penicillium subrubescens]